MLRDHRSMLINSPNGAIVRLSRDARYADRVALSQSSLSDRLFGWITLGLALLVAGGMLITAVTTTRGTPLWDTQAYGRLPCDCARASHFMIQTCHQTENAAFVSAAT